MLQLFLSRYQFIQFKKIHSFLEYIFCFLIWHWNWKHLSNFFTIYQNDMKQIFTLRLWLIASIVKIHPNISNYEVNRIYPSSQKAQSRIFGPSGVHWQWYIEAREKIWHWNTLGVQQLQLQDHNLDEMWTHAWHTIKYFEYFYFNGTFFIQTIVESESRIFAIILDKAWEISSFLSLGN